MTIRKNHLSRHSQFVVYVTYPNNHREYAYLCNIPNVTQGSEVLGNGNTRCKVIRTAAWDPLAVRWVRPVPDHSEIVALERRDQIKRRLREIEGEVKQLEIWTHLARKSPEAKKLLAEYKALG